MFKQPSSSFSLPKRQKENVQMSVMSDYMGRDLIPFNMFMCQKTHIMEGFCFVRRSGHVVTGQ